MYGRRCANPDRVVRVDSDVDVGIGIFRGVIHIVVLAYLHPVQISLFVYLTLAALPDFVNVTVHPAL